MSEVRVRDDKPSEIGGEELGLWGAAFLCGLFSLIFSVPMGHGPGLFVPVGLLLMILTAALIRAALKVGRQRRERD